MRRSLRAATAIAATTVLGAAGYRLLSNRSERRDRSGRRHVVTVHRAVGEVRENLPEVLNDRGGEIVVDLREAPGGRGTEIGVRAASGTVSDGDLRRLLRESRSLLEVGEVLRPGGPTTEPTLLNRPLRAVTRRGREGGLW